MCCDGSSIMYEWVLLVLCLAKYVGSRMEGLIFQGEYTDLTQYPHQVYLDIFGVEPSICGGSILNHMLVLTAAHCVEDLNDRYNRLNVMYGSDNIDNFVLKRMKSFIIHENYEDRSMQADIALILCKSPFTLGKLVKKVAIVLNPPRWYQGFVAGWGAINKRMDTSNILKHTVQELQPYTVCSKIGIPRGSFCAGPIQGPGNPSEGDSGGALMINKYIQVGIVSYKEAGYTLVTYTNVSYYYGWIYSKAHLLYCRNRN